MAKKGGGHHGGAWKVAYADFVTALMALFMVLWISSQNVEIRKATSRFFQDPYNAFPERSSGMMSSQVAGSRNDESHTDPTAPANMGFLDAIAKELYRLVNVEEKQDQKPMDIQVTSDGLRINLYNRAARPLFLKDSAEFTDWGKFVIQTVSWIIDRYDFKVFIDGHTPSGREPLRKDYGAWELSADRANASRRAMQHYAVDGRLIERVAGFGDTAPLPNTAPDSDSNERITISLSARQGSRKQADAMKKFRDQKAQSVTSNN